MNLVTLIQFLRKPAAPGLGLLLGLSAVRAGELDGGTFKPFIDETQGQTIFAFDSVAIPFTRSLELKMQAPVKYSGNPVVARGPKGEPDHWGVQFYGSIIRENGKFRLWYAAFDGARGESKGPNSAWWRAAYAESTDGVNWTKPKLGLVEYKGNKDNNLLAVDPVVGILNLKVLHEPQDADPFRRYKMITHVYWMKGKTRHGTLVPFTSADGLTWKSTIDFKPVDSEILERDLIIPNMHFEPAGGFYKWDGQYFASGQSPYDGTRPSHSRIARSIRSRDFVNWSPTANLNFMRPEQHTILPVGNDGKQTHEGISVWHRGNVLIGLYGIWNGAKTWAGVTVDMGLVISNDGLAFREPTNDPAFIPRGEDGTWDQGGLMQGQGFENVGDKTYVYYGAADPRSWTAADRPIPPRGGVGLVTLPRDRFGDLRVRDYGEGASEFVTGDIAVSGKAARKFYFNADGLGADAVLKVELLTHDEQLLKGYSGKDAATVTQSGFQTPLIWNGKETVKGLPERFRIKVSFDGAKKADIRFSALYVQDAR